MTFTIVTGANAAYWTILADLINSIRSKPGGRALAISVLDLGLDEEQLTQLEQHVTAIVKPGWDIDFPDQAEQADWFKAMVARPFLPEHFPGYDAYLWIDADAWVQDLSVLDGYLAAAARGKLAITPELDRCMIPDWAQITGRMVGMSLETYRLGWDEELAKTLARRPMLNSGVFALAAGAPHWAAWRESLRDALQRTSNFMVEQTALNHAVHTHELPASYLPLYCNWLCHVALPWVDKGARRLVEPEAPHQPLGIVHLTHKTKNGDYELPAVTGGTVTTSLRFNRLDGVLTV